MKEGQKKLLKYKELASTATFTNRWLRKILKANPEKTLKQNRIITGSSIDGHIISMKIVEKWLGSCVVSKFLKALNTRSEFASDKITVHNCGLTLWVHREGNGDVIAGMSREYKANDSDYLFLLINDNTFIGYDVD